ncbi:MAG: histidinol-phosphate transaminase [Gemmatimonadaceae bacterium]|nr:histidinol-phosphate transaminase [Gemmatimonadaceae bacterium]
MTAFELDRPSLREVPFYAPDATSCAVDLRDNTNLWGAPPAALAALRALDPTALSLYPGVSAGKLTDAVATYVGVAPSEVAAGCGSDDLIDAAFRAVAEPGAVLAYPTPSFSMVPIFARLNGLQPVAVPLTRDGAADADAMIATGARIIYLCSPNNPTGTVTPADVVRRIVRESNAIVMLDGAYAEFAPDLEDLLKEAPALGRLLVLRTFSKAWGLAGLRVGYAVGSTELVRAVRKSNGPYKVNALAERAACVALAEDAGWMRARAAEAVVSRERVTQALRTMGLSPLDSRGNFVCVPVPDARALADRLAERGVAVRAFAGLPVFGDVLRVGMGPWPVMEQFIGALREALA